MSGVVPALFLLLAVSQLDGSLFLNQVAPVHIEDSTVLFRTGVIFAEDRAKDPRSLPFDSPSRAKPTAGR